MRPEAGGRFGACFLEFGGLDVLHLLHLFSLRDQIRETGFQSDPSFIGIVAILNPIRQGAPPPGIFGEKPPTVVSMGFGYMIIPCDGFAPPHLKFESGHSGPLPCSMVALGHT
jgi:hypothetical protein